MKLFWMNKVDIISDLSQGIAIGVGLFCPLNGVFDNYNVLRIFSLVGMLVFQLLRLLFDDVWNLSLKHVSGTGIQMEKINKENDLCDNSKTNLCKSYVFLMGSSS